jgi:4-hydroxybenzoate polyprenyltransferase
VTFAVSFFAFASGQSALGTVGVAIAVLLGQLSVGWSNDAIDAPRDRAVSRVSKPIVAGAVERTLVARCAIAALAASVVLSFVLAGGAGGACHLVFLASAWAYNLGLKRTVVSLVPYLVGFAALPGFVTYGLDPARAPEAWLVLVSGLLGLAAGLSNAAHDVDDDRSTQVRGAVVRMGADTARVWCVVVLIAATVVLAVGAGFTAIGSLAAIAGAALLGGIGLTWRDGARLFPVVMVMAIALVALAGLAAAD